MNFAGVDVGKSSLHLGIHGNPESVEFSNTARGRQALLKRLGQVTPVRVVVEPTARYHLELAKELAVAGDVEVMLANPRATANFAKAMDQRGKSDVKDCLTLAAYAATMPFKPWSAPSKAVEKLRALMRRRHQLVVNRTQEKVRLIELKSTGNAQDLRDDIQAHIGFLSQQIATLERRALGVTNQDPLLQRWRLMLTSIPGIGDVLAMVVTAELVHLPVDITGRQLAAYAGLDPTENQSGKRDGVRRISRRGNKRLRTALYIATTVASRFSPHVKAWKEQRLERGKAPKLVNIAIARRLLHVIVALNATDARWDGQRFHRLPEAEVA